MRKFLRYTIPGVATALIAMSQVGPEDAVSNLGKWVEFLTRLPMPDWLLAPRVDRAALMLGATMLLAWSIWFSWRRLEPHVDVGWLWLQRSVGYVDGQWTWRLRTPWERIGPSPNPRQEITRPVSFYQAHVDQTGAAHEVLARYLFALDELISKPVSSSGEVNNQSRAFESLRAEIIAFVRQAVSHSEAYHLAHPGLSIITRDPDAFDDAHNALRHRMYAFCESLRHAHRRELPPLDKAQRISTLAVQPIPTESAARYYSQARPWTGYRGS
jgi:hypothetical protein